MKDVSDEMIAWKTEGTRLYQALPKQLHATLKAVRAAARDAGRSTSSKRTSYRNAGTRRENHDDDVDIDASRPIGIARRGAAAP